MNTYYRGQDVTLRVDFQTAGRTPADPQTVVLAVAAPSGIVTTLTATRTGTGRYEAVFSTGTAESGVHRATATGEGGLVANTRQDFLILTLPGPGA